MRRAKYIHILRPTAREWDRELWAFQAGDEIAVGGGDVLEEPPTVPIALACDLLRSHDAEALAMRDVSGEPEADDEEDGGGLGVEPNRFVE